MNVKEFLRMERHRLGLEHVDFVSRKRLNRSGLPRFINHLAHLNIHIATVIEAGVSALPPIKAYRFFPHCNYMFYNTVNGRPVVNFYAQDKRDINNDNPEKSTSNVQPEQLADICREYGFYGPYLLIIEADSLTDNEGLLSPVLMASSPLLFLAFDENSLVTGLDPIEKFDDLARRHGFLLHECLEADVGTETSGFLNIFIYARNGHRILRRYAANDPKPGPVSERRNTGPGLKNCLIFGTGRSGTSMAGGIMYEAGYYMGENLYRGRETNPKGFFECAAINFINEEILKKNQSRYRSGSDAEPSPSINTLADNKFRPVHDKGQGWLSVIPVTEEIEMDDPMLLDKIKEFVKREPFCYKDPRFCYTLPVWLRFLERDTVLICIFREPAKTINSILMECRRMPYLRDLVINKEIAYSVYECMYGHVLKNAVRVGERMVFVHYNQLLSGAGLKILSAKLGLPLSGDFIDASLDRTRNDTTCPDRVKGVYEELCRRAEYS